MTTRNLMRVALLLGASFPAGALLLAQGPVSPGARPAPVTANPATTNPVTSFDRTTIASPIIASSNPVKQSGQVGGTVISTSSDPLNPDTQSSGSTANGGGRLLPPLGSMTQTERSNGSGASLQPAPSPLDSRIAASTSSPIAPVVGIEGEQGPSPHPFLPSGPMAPVSLGNQGGLTVRVEGTAQAVAGETLGYTIVLRNSGATVLDGIRMEQAIPNGATIAVTIPKAIHDSSRLIWNIGRLEPNSERRIRLELQPGNIDEFNLDPLVTYKVSNSHKTRIQQPPFSLTQAGPETAERGGQMVVQMTLSNQGATPLHGLKLKVMLSPGLKHPQGTQIEAGLETLKPGEKRVIPLGIMAIQDGLQTVSAVATSQEGPVSRSKFNIQVKEGGLGLIPTSSPIPGSPDHELRIEVTNPTKIAAKNIKVVIQYPDHTEVHRVSHEGKIDIANRLMHWSGVGNLPPDRSVTIIAHVQPPGPGDWPLTVFATADGMPESKSSFAVKAGSTQPVQTMGGLESERIR